MTSQFENFKKNISWSKSNEAWCGTFAVRKNAATGGINLSVVALPAMKSKVAKPYICERLFEIATQKTTEWGLDLEALIQEGLKQIKD